ncbi:MAG: methyltransferase domain-containing protein [Nanoarchaeota archaeon]|nr:methyltransferase domain-containing protein [Nanoarchaeota archaeon]
MDHDEFYRMVNRTREEFFWSKYRKHSYPENKELREAQLNVLLNATKGYEGGSAIEVLCGEGVLSYLAAKEGIFDKVVLVDNNPEVLELTEIHRERFGLEEKVDIIELDIEEQTPIGNYNIGLAICTEMFNPNYPLVIEALGKKYIPPDPIKFLETFSKKVGKIIVMEAYREDGYFEASPDEYIKNVANEVELKAEVGKIPCGKGMLYYGILETPDK